MIIRGICLAGCLLLGFAAAGSGAEWYQSYEKGYKAVDKGRCDEGMPLLKEALAKNPKPDLKARPYGMITWEYIPHFYLAKCAIQAGDFAGAKEYVDSAQVDLYASSKSAEFRKMQKTLDEKLGDKKPPVTTPTGPAPTIPAPTTPTTSPSADRKAVINRMLNEARMSFAAGDYASARDAVERVLVLDRGNVEALTLRLQISQKETAAAAVQQKQQKIGEARRALSRGDLVFAENLAIELKSAYPGDRAVGSLISEIDRTKAAKMKNMQADESKKFMERQIINAFYTGKYNAVVELSQQSVQQHPDSWRLLFYQGCAYAALSILDTEKRDQRLNLARESFRKARAAAGGDITQPPQISPKIWDVYRSS